MDQSDSLKLQDLFDRYYRPRKLLGRTKKTAYQYGVQFRHLERFLKREPTIADLDDDTIAAFLQWLYEGADRGGRMRSPETANKARSHLLALWRFANAIGMIAKGPTIDQLPVPESMPQAWTGEQIAMIFDACRRTRGWIAGIPEPDYYEALHYWWMCGGERTSATFAIEWAWVDLRRAVVSIPGKVRKAGVTISYAISPDCVQAFRKIMEPQREKVFPWPWHMHTFWNRYRKIIASAGLPTKNAGPQKMRRSFASHLAAAGGDATKALHHSNRSVTVKSYLDPRIVQPTEHWRLLPSFSLQGQPT